MPATVIGPIPQAWVDAVKAPAPPAAPTAPATPAAAAPPGIERERRAETGEAEPIPPTVALQGLDELKPPAPPAAEAAPSARVPVLVPVGDAEGMAAHVLKPGVSVVGRTSDKDIRVDDHRVSRKHATFHVDEYVVLLTDEGSANGTFVNDEKIKWRELKEGDVVAFGTVKYRLTFRSG